MFTVKSRMQSISVQKATDNTFFIGKSFSPLFEVYLCLFKLLKKLSIDGIWLQVMRSRNKADFDLRGYLSFWKRLTVSRKKERDGVRTPKSRYLRELLASFPTLFFRKAKEPASTATDDNSITTPKVKFSGIASLE
jgi:hypothetical protein